MRAIASQRDAARRAHIEHVADHAAGVHAHERGVELVGARHVAVHTREVLPAAALEHLHGPRLSARQRERAGGLLHDELLVLEPVLDQIGDREDAQTVLLREADEIGHARHRSVVVHDLADHARRVEPGLGISGFTKTKSQLFFANEARA